MGALDSIVREAVLVCATLCFPLLAAATTIGLAVAVVQAATQIQEQTLTLLPKMIAVAAAVGIFGSSALHACARLFEDAVAALPAIARGG